MGDNKKQPAERPSLDAAEFPTLPSGVFVTPLRTHVDKRGSFTEVFRQTWFNEIVPIQWNFVASRANVLRGVHVHLRHSDYLILLSGRICVALKDLRPASPTQGMATMIQMTGQALRSLIIPPGVAHGFYFPEESTHVYAVSEYWSVDDELGFHYADPGLHLTWPNPAPIVSPRDAALPPLSALAGVIPTWRPCESPLPAAAAESIAADIAT